MPSPSLSIAFVTVADLPEGGGRTGRLRTLAGALVGMGHRVVIWNEHGMNLAGVQHVSGELGGTHFEYVLGTTQRAHGFRAVGLKLRAVRRILDRMRAAARVGQLDLILLNNLALYDTYPITRLARRLGLPTIQCYEDERHEVVNPEKFGLAQRVFGWNAWAADHWCSGLADQIWVISSYLREKYARLSRHPDRVRVIPTIVDCDAWALPPEPLRQTPVIFYSGGFGEQDDFEKLALALADLKRRNVGFCMRFLGAKPEVPGVRRLQSLVRHLGLEDCTKIKGFYPAHIVKEEVGNANILVNLRTNSIWSRSGLSTKLSEYLAAGRAVLTTSVGDNARYVEDGKSALVVSPDDGPEKVAAVLKQAIENAELRRRLGEGGRQAALRHFDVPVIQQMIAESLSALSLCPKVRKSNL